MVIYQETPTLAYYIIVFRGNHAVAWRDSRVRGPLSDREVVVYK